MLTAAAVLFCQAALCLFGITRYPKSLAAILRAAAALIDIATAAASTRAGKFSGISSERHIRRSVTPEDFVNPRRTRRNAKATREANAAEELEAPSDKLESDLTRALVHLGSSESGARLHVLSLRERGLINPGMTLEEAAAVTFRQLQRVV